MLIRNGEIAAAKNVKFSIAFSPFCFVFYPLSLVTVVIWKVYITNEFTNNTSLTIYLILVVHTEFLGPVICFSILLMADLNTRPSKSIVYAVIKLSWAMGLDQSA